ncbi:MAG: hypothetical protein UY16_C0012G0015 [Candidatus Gottesmanbacteria bacterium GW2011_GWA2_47_9]|uniref:EamA domain-containing protein n=1 Tax=Candidatus Gottesmanbacteria bacterium GW2011_GWA2_47_9 TaxID=1618445 RepID=A0A0G1U273_9BACT|nr:MAG: hypothetical protein UY16_C0012G0015 [Candidatus Gottesmanbacteria bacterium GW2011_GWA2_47_9]
MWIVYALLTVLSYAFMDFFVKKAAGRIDDALGAALINIFSVLPPMIWFISSRLTNKDVIAAKEGYLFAALAGVAIGFGSIFFIKMFATGTNLSIGVPLVRIGIVLLAVAIGALVLKESLSVKQLFGLALSVVGLYLVIAK